MIELGTPAQVAKVLHTTEASLAQMRYRGDGPIFVRAGRRRVLYRWADVDQWIKDSLHSRTDRQEVEANSSRACGRPGRRNRDERG
ncbi:MAG: helix-turn-helix transcriptional regulator [Actinomycetota bacterium]